MSETPAISNHNFETVFGTLHMVCLKA